MCSAGHRSHRGNGGVILRLGSSYRHLNGASEPPTLVSSHVPAGQQYLFSDYGLFFYVLTHCQHSLCTQTIGKSIPCRSISFPAVACHLPLAAASRASNYLFGTDGFLLGGDSAANQSAIASPQRVAAVTLLVPRLWMVR